MKDRNEKRFITLETGGLANQLNQKQEERQKARTNKVENEILKIVEIKTNEEMQRNESQSNILQSILDQHKVSECFSFNSRKQTLYKTNSQVEIEKGQSTVQIESIIRNSSKKKLSIHQIKQINQMPFKLNIIKERGFKSTTVTPRKKNQVKKKNNSMVQGYSINQIDYKQLQKKLDQTIQINQKRKFNKQNSSHVNYISLNNSLNGSFTKDFEQEIPSKNQSQFQTFSNASISNSSTQEPTPLNTKSSVTKAGLDFTRKKSNLSQEIKSFNQLRQLEINRSCASFKILAGKELEIVKNKVKNQVQSIKDSVDNSKLRSKSNKNQKETVNNKKELIQKSQVTYQNIKENLASIASKDYQL